MTLTTWLRIGAALAAAALLWLAFKAFTGHYVTQGRADVQAKWDAQKLLDAEAARRRGEELRAEENAKRINSERVADEQALREKVRADRLAAADRTVDSLRDSIAKLNADDLSAAAGDPRVAAFAQRAATARELLGSCSARYTGLAAKADRLRDQVAGLLDDAINVCRGGLTTPPLELSGWQ
jgi:hypothetical protein